MDRRLAEDIFWVLTSRDRFMLDYPDENDYDRLKKERVKIANRYAELKLTHSFFDSERIAMVEWLMNIGEESG